MHAQRVRTPVSMLLVTSVDHAVGLVQSRVAGLTHAITIVSNYSYMFTATRRLRSRRHVTMQW